MLMQLRLAFSHVSSYEGGETCPALRRYNSVIIPTKEVPMYVFLLTVSFLTTAQTHSLKPGDHRRSLQHEDSKRTYIVHVPPSYDPRKPTPVVLAYHGASMIAEQMPWLTNLSKKADRAGFVVVYPNGTGVIQTWNAGLFPSKNGKNKPDDVGFTVKMLDDLEAVLNVDKKRIYATGMSNGGMMCYRLAAELSDRIAAIAPVAGTMALDKPEPKRPVPVLHIHGTADTLVPFEGWGVKKSTFMKVLGVEDTISAWVKLNRCEQDPLVEKLPTPKDKLEVTKKTYRPLKAGAEVVLCVVQGGGHTWPGGLALGGLLGACTYNISATDALWEFFQKHSLP